MMLCPCRSGTTYRLCCEPFHQGQLPDSALQLMRSRYAAYALCLPSYIMETTHPANPHFRHDTATWSKELSAFCLQTEFTGLDILAFQENGPFATVTFVAHLLQNKKDASFTETSHFEKVNGKWLYHSGQLSRPILK